MQSPALYTSLVSLSAKDHLVTATFILSACCENNILSAGRKQSLRKAKVEFRAHGHSKEVLESKQASRAL